MNLLCPLCQKMVSVPEQYAGQLTKCPLCGGTFTVPAPPAGASSASGTRRQVVPPWVTGLTLGLLVVASLVAWYRQPSPVAVARQHLSEQQGAAPDELELVGFHGTAPLGGVILSEMTVEFRKGGAGDSKKRVVELTRPVYFLPWRVSALREGNE
jgi:hypothetical protein